MHSIVTSLCCDVHLRQFWTLKLATNLLLTRVLLTPQWCQVAVLMAMSYFGGQPRHPHYQNYSIVSRAFALSHPSTTLSRGSTQWWILGERIALHYLYRLC